MNIRKKNLLFSIIDIHIGQYIIEKIEIVHEAYCCGYIQTCKMQVRMHNKPVTLFISANTKKELPIIGPNVSDINKD